MSKRKRGFTRHTYTVVRKSLGNEWVEGVYTEVDVYTYFRGQGQLVPLNRPKGTLSNVGARLEIEAELELHTKDDYPRIDPYNYTTGNGSNQVTYGSQVDPDFVIYKNTPFTALGLNSWLNNGQNDYNRIYLGYTSVEEGIVSDLGNLYSLDWDEISSFETAVNGVEFMNTLVLDKVM